MIRAMWTRKIAHTVIKDNTFGNFFTTVTCHKWKSYKCQITTLHVLCVTTSVISYSCEEKRPHATHLNIVAV